MALAGALAAAFVPCFAAADPLSAGTPSASAASETLLLPGVANAVGTHGARWRSDVSLKNPGNDPIEVRVFFIRSGQPNELATAPRKDYFLLAGEMRELRNVLGSEFGLAGTGVLLVSVARAIFPNNPAGAAVTALMRTATPLILAPGDAGSAVSPAEPTDAARQLVGGIKHDGVGEKGYRGAIGAVNLSRTQGLTLRIEYLDRGGEVLAERDLHLPPLSTAQQTVPVRMSGGAARLVRIDGSGPYVAYATAVDNATSEATFTYAAPEAGQPSGVRPVAYSSLGD